MSLVDVIVPTYNRPGSLARALASIRAQTMVNYQIVVVNDAGEDVSKLCQLFGAMHIRQEANGGLPKARNTGIRETSSNYVAYLDDDDVWLPQHLAKLVGLLMESKSRLAYSDCIFWNYEREYDLIYGGRFDREALLDGHNMAPVCSVVHERALFDEPLNSSGVPVGLFDESFPSHEDLDLWMRMSEVTDFEHLGEVTALYSRRFTEEQMSFMGGRMVEGRKMAMEKARERALITESQRAQRL